MEENKKFVQKCIENLKNHLKTNHSDLANIKVFENVGEFPFVVKFTAFVDYDLNLTLQINSDLNLANSILILSSRQNKNLDKKIKTLEEVLIAKLNELDAKNEKFLIKFSEKAFENIEKNFDKYQTESKAKTSKVKEQKVKAALSDEEQATKKSSMKTANDVINRIQWDEEINKEFITVGYLDRFLGLKECSFNTFDWGDIVLADLGALAVPEHRIAYFKYKNEIIWDKKSRMDNIFGSTGSNITIRNVVKRLENTEFEQKPEEQEEVHKQGRADGAKKDQTPNYFISIPVISSEIKENMHTLAYDLLAINPDVDNFLVPDTSAHLTVCTLRIDSDEEIQNVKNVMKSLEKNEKFLKENFPINLKFKGCGQFYDKVFYIKCLTEDFVKLENVKKVILDKFKDADVNVAGNYYDFVPHLTVFKIKSNSKNNTGDYNVTDLTDKSIWAKYENFDFGQQKVNTIDLCKMVNIYNFKTYPVEFSINIV